MNACNVHRQYITVHFWNWPLKEVVFQLDERDAWPYLLFINIDVYCRPNNFGYATLLSPKLSIAKLLRDKQVFFSAAIMHQNISQGQSNQPVLKWKGNPKWINTHKQQLNEPQQKLFTVISPSLSSHSQWVERVINYQKSVGLALPHTLAAMTHERTSEVSEVLIESSAARGPTICWLARSGCIRKQAKPHVKVMKVKLDNSSTLQCVEGHWDEVE